MAEDYVHVNAPSNPGDKLKAFKTTDGDANEVKAQAVVVTDGTTGAETKVATEQTLQSVLAALATLDGGVFAAPFSGINGDAVTLVAGTPVAMPVATLLRGVNNTGSSLAGVLGLVVVDADVTMPTRALARGSLTLPTSVWDVVTGASGGLVPGAKYYLSDVLGMMTTTPPSLGGTYVVLLGTAVSTITLLVDPQPPILL